MTSLSQTYTRRASLNSKNGMMLLSLLADEGFSRRINIVNNIFVWQQVIHVWTALLHRGKVVGKTWDNKYLKNLSAWRNWANVRIAVRVYLVSEFIRNAPKCRGVTILNIEWYKVAHLFTIADLTYGNWRESKR